jgi:hypothetical protein
MNKTETLEKQVASNYKDAMEAATVAAAYAEENAKLRAFAQEIMEAWAEGSGLDGRQMQDVATKHGILRQETMHEPCGKFCNCDDHRSQDEWIDGVVCYRETALLLGDR